MYSCVATIPEGTICKIERWPAVSFSDSPKHIWSLWSKLATRPLVWTPPQGLSNTLTPATQTKCALSVPFRTSPHWFPLLIWSLTRHAKSGTNTPRMCLPYPHSWPTGIMLLVNGGILRVWVSTMLHGRLICYCCWLRSNFRLVTSIVFKFHTMAIMGKLEYCLMRV